MPEFKTKEEYEKWKADKINRVKEIPAEPVQKSPKVEAPKEKKCPHCAMLIPKEAKVCPHCRKTLGTSIATKIIIGIIALFIFLPILTRTMKSGDNVQSNRIIDETPITPEGSGIKNQHPLWSNDICNTIAKKQIKIGMTQEQVIDSWGKPHKINTTTTGNSEHEQWVMSDNIGSDYLYFDNGILRSIQQSK